MSDHNTRWTTLRDLAERFGQLEVCRSELEALADQSLVRWAVCEFGYGADNGPYHFFETPDAAFAYLYDRRRLRTLLFVDLDEKGDLEEWLRQTCAERDSRDRTAARPAHRVERVSDGQPA